MKNIEKRDLYDINRVLTGKTSLRVILFQITTT